MVELGFIYAENLLKVLKKKGEWRMELYDRIYLVAHV